eukprot:1185976-Prorocentrum_minimum.AAC.8
MVPVAAFTCRGTQQIAEDALIMWSKFAGTHPTVTCLNKAVANGVPFVAPPGAVKTNFVFSLIIGRTIIIVLLAFNARITSYRRARSTNGGPAEHPLRSTTLTPSISRPP